MLAFDGRHFSCQLAVKMAISYLYTARRTFDARSDASIISGYRHLILMLARAMMEFMSARCGDISRRFSASDETKITLEP